MRRCRVFSAWGARRKAACSKAALCYGIGHKHGHPPGSYNPKQNAAVMATMTYKDMDTNILGNSNSLPQPPNANNHHTVRLRTFRMSELAKFALPAAAIRVVTGCSMSAQQAMLWRRSAGSKRSHQGIWRAKRSKDPNMALNPQPSTLTPNPETQV